MKSKKDIAEMLKRLEEQGYNHSSCNMQYEWCGAKDALEWVLGLKKHLFVGQR